MSNRVDLMSNRIVKLLALGVPILMLGSVASWAGTAPPEPVVGPINTIVGNGATVTEQGTTVGGESSIIEYTIENTGLSDPEDSIIGFAVDFGLSELGSAFPFVDREFWSARVLTESQWNSGSSDSDFGFGTGSDGIGAFDQFFFDDDVLQAVVFYFDTDLRVVPNPILTTEGVVDGFSIEFAVPLSTIVAICTGGVLCSQEVPEPGALALFGIGLVGMGAMARRRRKAA